MLVLGDHSIYTWRSAKDRFSPSRLDFLSYSDSVVNIEEAFALDTSLLSDSVLKEAGLERKDTDSSDHLPIVLDISPKK